MILEEETFKKFGYYPGDLKPQSGKRVLATCEECGVIREIIKNQYRALCLSCKGKGKRNPLFGKGHLHQGKNNPNWKGGKTKCICQFCDTEFEIPKAWIKKGGGIFCSTKCHGEWKKKNWKGKNMDRARKALNQKPTKPELIFEKMCKENDLPFKYVGDGQLWIGKDKILNPDFIEVNSKKICVEIMGAYWHSPLLNQNLRKNANLNYRKKHYKKYKWIPIFIWDTDLLRKDAEQFVLSQLSKY